MLLHEESFDMHGNDHPAIETLAVEEPRASTGRWSLEFPWRSRDIAPERIVAILIDHSVSIGASDIFFAFNEDDVEITVRHLGIIRPLAVLGRESGTRCVAHIRTMGELKLTDRKHPQDGRWVFRLDSGKLIDLRIATMPTLYGESLSIRVLERESHLQSLNALGLVGPQLGLLVSTLHSPSGLVLVTGPTGSGKTTTLYACLHYLNDGTRKIHTLEDPVEYAVRGLHQTQVDAATGADFQEMLRGVLRQGPDVVLVGEVRDRETAETAIRAANSGQLVFASLHAPEAAAALQSMLSLNISGYFLCTSLLAVVCQRLMRTVNREAAKLVELSSINRSFDEVQPWLDAPVHTAYVAGADHKGSEGYSGRAGVFEILKPTPALRDLIAQGEPASVIGRQAISDGMLDLRRAALLKVALGLSTFHEFQRIVPSDNPKG